MASGVFEPADFAGFPTGPRRFRPLALSRLALESGCGRRLRPRRRPGRPRRRRPRRIRRGQPRRVPSGRVGPPGRPGRARRGGLGRFVGRRRSPATGTASGSGEPAARVGGSAPQTAPRRPHPPRTRIRPVTATSPAARSGLPAGRADVVAVADHGGGLLVFIDSRLCPGCREAPPPIRCNAIAEPAPAANAFTNPTGPPSPSGNIRHITYGATAHEANVKIATRYPSRPVLLAIPACPTRNTRITIGLANSRIHNAVTPLDTHRRDCSGPAIPAVCNSKMATHNGIHWLDTFNTTHVMNPAIIPNRFTNAIKKPPAKLGTDAAAVNAAIVLAENDRIRSVISDVPMIVPAPPAPARVTDTASRTCTNIVNSAPPAPRMNPNLINPTNDTTASPGRNRSNANAVAIKNSTISTHAAIPAIVLNSAR